MLSSRAVRWFVRDTAFGRWLNLQRRARNLLSGTETLDRRQRFFAPFVQPGALCFDVGANVGQTSVPLGRLGGRVVALEPDPEAAAVLERVTEPYEVTVLRAAAGAVETTGRLFKGESTPLNSMAPEWIEAVREARGAGDEAWGDSVEVQVLSLDGVIAEFGLPDLIKVDVEGYEFEVLQGLSQWPTTLIFEHTPERAEATVACLGEISARGAEYLGNVTRANQGEFQAAHWLPVDELVAQVARWGEPMDLVLCQPGAVPPPAG